MSSFASPLGTLGVTITGDVSDLQQAFDQAGAAANDLGRQFDGLANAGQAMMGVGAGLTAAITVPLTGIGVAAVSAAEQLNMAKVAFTTMLGSAEAADTMLQSLQKFAATTPFEFPDLVSAAQRMKALGFESSQIIPTLTTVGDAAAAMGKGKEVIDGITKALSDMQNKGKVSAQEMNQLAERGIPGWKILADAIGISIPAAMKLAENGAIAASEAVPALLAGMNEKFGGSMAAMSQTLTGQWSNMKDKLTLALIPIGQALVPALQQLMPILTTVLTKVGEAATWFGQLSAPVQAAAGTIALLAAAIGPILVTLGGMVTAVASLATLLAPMGLTIAGVTAAVAPWVLAIGAALAALVALGVWVTENWDPIVAVIKGAWEGILENWTAIWDAVSAYITGVWNTIASAVQTVWEPIGLFFSTIWDSIGPYFTAAWDGIKAGLSTVWKGVKTVATTIWDGITGVFKTFLEWAAKIPGAQKLMNLDDTWASAKKASEELDKTAKATKEVGKASAAAAPKIKLASSANKEAEAAAKKAEKAAGDHARAVADAWDAAHKRYDEADKQAKATLAWFEAAYPKLKQLDRDLEKSASDLATDYAKSHEAIRAEATKTVDVIVPATKRIPPEVQAVIDKNKALETAYKDLGVTSAAELLKHYGEAKKNYDLITASGTGSARDIDAAWVAMETARQAALTAASTQIPADQKAMLDKMKTQLETAKTDQKTVWTDMSTQVSTIITNFAQDIGKSLFEGDLSWGEKMKGMLKSLGSAVTASFIEPAATAIGNFISGALKDLISGDEGFSSLKKTITGIGDLFSSIFGKGGSIAKDSASAGEAISGIGGGGGGAAGSVAGAAGAGLAGIVTAVAGVVTAISSVIQNFQLAKMETTLNEIEHSTRYSMMYLGERADGGILGRLYDISDKTQWLPGLLDGINAKLTDWLEPLHGDLTDIYGEVMWAKVSTKAIETNIADIRGYLETTRNNTTAMREAMTTGATWTVQFQGDPIASMVGQEIMRQLRLQGVNLV